MFLICYDIQDDNIRTRLANRLLKAGLERIQFSVFVGKLNSTRLKKLNAAIQAILLKSTTPTDSIIVFPLHADALRDAQTFGKPVDYFLHPPNTLFV